MLWTSREEDRQSGHFAHLRMTREDLRSTTWTPKLVDDLRVLVDDFLFWEDRQCADKTRRYLDER